MIRKTTGRIISLVLAATLALTSYVPSYANEIPEDISEEITEELSEDVLEEETEDLSEDLSEDVLEEELGLTTNSRLFSLMSSPEAVSIPIKYEGDLTFSDQDNQPPTSIEWTGESTKEFTVPFPDIPEGFELKSMWAVFKSERGYINLPESRNDETSTYTFTNYYFDMMDLEEGITVGADFAMVYDDDPNKEVIIPIRYSLNYHFPDNMPKSVSGKVGEKVYFKLPYPDIPEGYKLNYLRCAAASYGAFDSLYGRIVDDDTAYLYEYVVSKDDIASGITVFPYFERIVEVVYEDGEHGHHVLRNDVEKTFSLEEFFFVDAEYPGMGLLTDYYYIPDHGYKLVGTYYRPEMDESCELYIPGTNGGTQIKESMLSEDGKLHVYAKWEPITAEIRLAFDNYSSAYSVTYGEQLPDFSKPSYITYQVKNDNQKIQVIPGESLFDENIQYSCDFDRITGLPTKFYFYVYAEKNPYVTVSFDTGVENSVVEAQKILKGKTVSKPDVQLSKEGHYLAGWYTDAAYKNIFTFGKTAVSKDTTLYAKWMPVEYVVTFHSNFGKDTTARVTYKITEKDENKNQGTVTAGSIFKTLSGQAGFSGWMSTDDLEFGSEVTGKELIEKLADKYGAPSAKVNLNLYAQWEEANNYTVILDSNLPSDSKVENLGGNRAKAAKENDATNPYVKQVVSADESMLLTGEEYTLKGFTLSGWEYMDSKGKKVSLRPSASPKNLTIAGEEITVKAVWKKVSSYKITYKVNGGTAGKNKTTITYSASAATKEGLPLYNYKKGADGSFVEKESSDVLEVTRPGYTFTGWAEGTSTYTYYGDDIYQNLTLTANWTPEIYTLKFMDPDGITQYFIEDASFESSFALKNYVPEKAGFTFKGWQGTYRNKSRQFSNGNTLKLKDLDMPNDGNYVLTAKFAASSYKLTYNLDGGKSGSRPTSYTHTVGSTKAIPDPQKDGFSFSGWTAKVTYGQDTKEYTTGNENDQLDISCVIDPATKKITAETYGNIELIANWTPYTYDVKFYNADGSEYVSDGNDLGNYLGLTYNDSIDFTAAAMFIESQEGFDENRSIKGFALTPTAKSPKYALYKKYSKLAAKSAGGTEIKVYPVLAGKTTRVNYSIILMPNAKDVKESPEATGYINNSKGIQYRTVDSDGSEISEFAYNTSATLTAPSWERYGYELVGFGTSARSTVPVTQLKELGNGRQSSVKLYAIWKANVNTITYSSSVHIYDPFMGYEYKDIPSFAGETTQTYMGKDVTLKTVSLKGYTFKGWAIETADGLAGPIKKVPKSNNANLQLSALFDRVQYNISFDPNGGIYEGSRKKQITYTEFYENDVSSIIEEFYKGVSREGYVISGISTTRNGKNRLALYDSEGNLQEISGLTEKNGATITLYPIWTKVSPASPKAEASLSVSGEDGKISLEMISSMEITPDKGSLVFEYSTSPLFIFGVKSVTLNSEDLDPENPGFVNNMTVVHGLRNRTYYVRVKYGEKDSSGKYIFSKYSKTISALRPKN